MIVPGLNWGREESCRPGYGIVGETRALLRMDYGYTVTRRVAVPALSR